LSHPDIAATVQKLSLDMEKETDIWHLVLLGENVLFKESPPSIMVIRNPNWSTEILWYETGYAKGKMLSPPKRPTWGMLHCWFCLKLLRICSPFSLFYSSFHVPDSSVSEQFLQIFPTLALVNIAQIQNIRYSWLWRQWIFLQKMNLKKKFSMSFFLIYPSLLFARFRWK
jgi:hypothetical protein